jgi:hypothetical protein
MGCNIYWLLEDQGEIQLFAIYGQLSHQSGPLAIADRAHGRYAQLYIINTKRAINERMWNNQQRYRKPQANWQIVERLTHMLQECQNPLSEPFKIAYERLQEVAAADPIVDPVTTMGSGSLPARLVAGHNTRTEYVQITTDIGSVMVDTAYSSNVRDIVL